MSAVKNPNQITASKVAEAPSVAYAFPVRTISFDDIKSALMRGIDDFRAMRSDALFAGMFYLIVNIVAYRLIFNYDLLPLVLPVLLGFALIGPFAALGLYELSRRREEGLDTTWWRMFEVLRHPARGAMLGLTFVLLGVFTCWLTTALAIYRLTFDAVPVFSTEFFDELFVTQHGWMLILLGNGVGALFAIITFSLSVVSFPLMLDRKATLREAVATSVEAVRHNPSPMVAWGVIIASALVAGALTLLIGLALVLPILGHASWHIYRAVVAK